MDRQVALLIALAGCGSSDLPCRLAAGTDVLECMELDVTAPVTFDHLEVFAATTSIATAGPIATPQIEAGAVLPDTFLVYARATTPAFDLDATMEWHGELASPASPALPGGAAPPNGGAESIDGWQKEVAIAASVNGSVVALGGIRLNLQSTITDGLEDIWYGGALELAAPPTNVELWGSSGDVACARVVLDQTFFFTREGDADCDGVADGVDPDPLHFDP